MIDEKRLAELMKPEELLKLAAHLEACHELMLARADHEYRIEGLASAAAVLREVAGREEITDRDMAMTALPPKLDAPGEPGSTDDLIADLREQLAEMEHSARLQLYRGNSRGHWYDKAQAYGNICSDLAGILRGQPGDDSRDQARKLVRRVAELEAIASNPADSIRDGIAQAFAEMPDQIYNAISEAVFSHLQKHGIQCPKAGR